MLRFVRSWSAISRSLPQSAPARRPYARRRLTLERLEDRAMLSTIALTVNTLDDDPITPITPIPGQTTLRDAINTADGGATTNHYVITFKQGLTGTIDLTTSALPDLRNNITIQGPGAANLTIQRDSNPTFFSVFTVDSGATVQISDVTISGGYGDYGGGINNSGTLTVNNSVFSNDSAMNYGGGIFNNTGGMTTVIGSTFTGNSTGYGQGYGQDGVGGGIFNYGASTVTVIDCTFTGNSTGQGGGLANYGTVTVIGSTFTDNYSATEGGGIYNAGTATIDSSCFTKNNSYLGGGIFTDTEGMTNGMTIVKISIFTDNFADAGGGIFNYGTTTVNNSVFSGNSAEAGGGIFNSSFENDKGTGIMTVRDCIFINDNVTDNGGGIYNYNEEGSLNFNEDSLVTVIDSIFIDNSAIDGGGIYNSGTLINTNNVFFDNTGGDIYS